MNTKDLENTVGSCAGSEIRACRESLDKRDGRR